MNKGYTLREFRDGDEEGIFELWQSIHPDDRTGRDEWMKYWTWLYRENPAVEAIIQVAEDNGKIITHHAIVPVWLNIGTEQAMGSWGVDAMTHPQYRRQGIWEKVIKEIWVRAADNGIDITPGFPNRYSLPGLTEKLQWFKITSMTLAFKPVDWEKTLAVKVGNRFLLKAGSLVAAVASGVQNINNRRLSGTEDISVHTITSFDDRFAALWDNVSRQYLIMTARTPAYLNWRFSRPDAEYTMMAAEKNNELQGYVVLRDRDVNGAPVSYIVDMVAESPETMRYLISESVKTCKRNGSAALLFSYIGDNRYRLPLKREGFLSFPFMKGGLFCARLNTDRFSQSMLQETGNWMVQPSDADTI